MSLSLTILLVLIIVILLSTHSFSNRSKESPAMLTHYQAAISQVKYWLYAAQQDSHPLLALLHATIASSKLQTVCLMISATEIQRLLKIDVGPMRESIIAVQQKAMTQMGIVCPALDLQSLELSSIFI